MTSRRRKYVVFSEQPEVRYIESQPIEPCRRPRRSRLNMERQVFEKYKGEKITEGMLQEAAQLFSENYGIWGEQAAKSVGKFAKAGNRVRISKDKLRADYLPDNTICSYVRVTVNDCLAGNAFAATWMVDDISVCWITQLVVDRKYRERGLAMGLLSQLREDNVDAYGLMSSHPAACLAAAKAFGGSINTVRLDFMRRNAQAIMEASPIAYVKDAKLRGSLFTPGDTSGLVSSVDTGFFVDHDEPLDALTWVRAELEWPLGELIDGHEFLLLIEARRRSRSRSLSKSRPKYN